MKRECKHCGKVLEIKNGKKLNPKKIFCDIKCRARFHARKSYNRLKDDPEYKKKQKDYFESWRKKNREHFNDLVREPNRLRAIKKRKEAREKGLCVRCYKEKPRLNRVKCSKCTEKEKIWRKKGDRKKA